MASKRTAERIAIDYLISVSNIPKTTVEIRDEICRVDKYGITCSGLKGVLRPGKFKRIQPHPVQRPDGSHYDVDRWSLEKYPVE